MISRYSVKKINDIFSDKRKYENWLKIEFLLLKYLSEKGYLDKKEVERAKGQVTIHMDQIKDEEKITKHDVVAFINCISRTIDSKEARKWIHYGLTSSDLVDTGNSMALSEVNELILEYAHRLLRRLKYLSYKHKRTYYLKREGGKVVGVSSFGHMVSRYYSSVKEFIDMFVSIRSNVECVSMSGSVGTCTYLGTEIQDYVANELGLFSVPISSQVVSRERYYTYFALLNYMGQVMNGLSLEFRMLAKTEIGEVSEAFERRQIGSSSMPHKRNPIVMENICGLSRLLEGYAFSSSKNSQIWHERDISHSSVDRVLFVDSTSIVVQIMKRMCGVLESLYVNVDLMKKRVEKHKLTFLKPRLAKFLFYKKLFFSEEEALSRLNEIEESAKEANVGFVDVFMKSSFIDKINKEELNKYFDVEGWFEYLDGLYMRIFGDSVDRSDFEEIYYEQSQIKYSIDVLAEKINYHYRNSVDPVTVVSFRDGCSAFLSKILLKFKFPVELLTINTSNIKSKIINGEKVKFDMDNSLIKRRNVLILDELVDTGTTLDFFSNYMNKNGAKTLKKCALFYSNRREIRENMDFVGLPLNSTKNLAGFGMDFNGRYRNLNFVGRVRESI